MDLPRKTLKQIVFNTRPKIEKLRLIVLDQPTHEEHLSQALQTNNKNFKTTVTFQSGYTGFFIATNIVINVFDFTGIFSPEGALNIESFNNAIKRNIFEERYFTEANCLFTNKPKFSFLGSAIEILSNITGSQTEDSVRKLLDSNQL